ncbi:MAG TPA: type II toxin-antitoxin system HigB family toxin [Blastocatellia bacterium]|nr:type II toxin-antitoxin system HigB family toxin [Blastocatellia bacterium]
MRIVNEERLSGFVREHPEAKSALLRWAAITKVSDWRNVADVRRSFRSADQVFKCLVFNILGNNYRLIARVYYAEQTVTLYHFLTHKEYDRDKWKKDCNS